jgi:hypothetical protein
LNSYALNEEAPKKQDAQNQQDRDDDYLDQRHDWFLDCSAGHLGKIQPLNRGILESSGPGVNRAKVVFAASLVAGDTLR